MKYVLALNNRTLLGVWDCKTPEDFVDALGIYFQMAVMQGRLTKYYDSIEYMGWCQYPEGYQPPSQGYRLVDGCASGTALVRAPYVGKLQWGLEGSFPHRALK